MHLDKFSHSCCQCCSRSRSTEGLLFRTSLQKIDLVIDLFGFNLSLQRVFSVSDKVHGPGGIIFAWQQSLGNFLATTG